jgi:hypothetical protein
MLHFVFIVFAWFSLQTAIISLNSIKQLIVVMVKCGVFFELRNEFVNNFYTSFVFNLSYNLLIKCNQFTLAPSAMVTYY